MRDRGGVTVHVASLNTRAATELCIRTMRRQAGSDFRLVVGDGGSTDGSVEMLRALEQRGWLERQESERRSHASWLDEWYVAARSRYLVFCDSDMEFRRGEWLTAMLERARDRTAALVALELRPPTSGPEPVSGRLVRGRPAPSTWLVLLDTAALAGVTTSFAFASEDTDAVPEGCIVWDTGARFLAELERSGMTAVAMPPAFQRAVKHYGSMTWMPSEGDPGRRKRRNLAVIERRLRAVRLLDERAAAGALRRARAHARSALRARIGRWSSRRARAGMRARRALRGDAASVHAPDLHPGG